jgi:hypothetical protein
LINGQEPNGPFLLKAGDPLSNERLAVLRAFSMGWHFQHAPHRDPVALGYIEQSRYLATTHTETGQQWRYARVVIKIKRRPLSPSRGAL